MVTELYAAHIFRKHAGPRDRSFRRRKDDEAQVEAGRI